jgi:hypothetical protein
MIEALIKKSRDNPQQTRNDVRVTMLGHALYVKANRLIQVPPSIMLELVLRITLEAAGIHIASLLAPSRYTRPKQTD